MKAHGRCRGAMTSANGTALHHVDGRGCAGRVIFCELGVICAHPHE